MSDSPRLTFYSRAYCHLCDDMLAARDSLRGELVFEVQVPNVDAEPELARKCNDLVPVLSGGTEEIFHYFLDKPKLREYLGRFR